MTNACLSLESTRVACTIFGSGKHVIIIESKKHASKILFGETLVFILPLNRISGQVRLI